MLTLRIIWCLKIHNTLSKNTHSNYHTKLSLTPPPYFPHASCRRSKYYAYCALSPEDNSPHFPTFFLFIREVSSFEVEGLRVSNRKSWHGFLFLSSLHFILFYFELIFSFRKKKKRFGLMTQTVTYSWILILRINWFLEFVHLLVF